MLELWAKQEGEAATKEEIIYVLDGMIASKTNDGSITKAAYEGVFE